jgi:hypothetical protein
VTDYPNRFQRGTMGADIFKEHFTQIFNGAMRDRRLSAKARGILGWSLTHKSGFSFSVASMVKAGLGGTEAVRTGLIELEKHGYLTRHRERDDKGRLGQTVYLLTDIPDGLNQFGDFMEGLTRKQHGESENSRSKPECENPMQDSDVQFVPNSDFPTQAKPVQADPAGKKNTFEEDHAFAAPQAVQKTPPPPPSSVGAGEDATPEAPLEEDEEIENFETNNDGFASGTPQEGLEGASEGLDGIPEWLATLPGLNGPQAPAHGFLEYPVMLAVRAGWTLQALKKHLAPLVDPSKARSKNAIPGWYDRHLGELPEPPKAVVPLCDNPAHQLSPQEDPVNGGCLLCNTQAATGPREKTAIPPGILQDTGGDTVALGVAFRADRRAKRLARVAEPSRSDTPQVRAHREAERNRVKANDLLRTER